MPPPAAQEWHDSETVLIGTKCNSLLRLDLPTRTVAQIARPAAPSRDVPTDSHGWGQCGIHCLSTNPARDLVATGGADPADCLILRTSDWSPVQTLVGHRDWVFGVAWVTDRHVVTGSRDGSAALWHVDPEGQEAVQRYSYYNPTQMKRKYGGKVRAVEYVAETGLVAALSTDGEVKLQDPTHDLRVVRSVRWRAGGSLQTARAGTARARPAAPHDGGVGDCPPPLSPALPPPGASQSGASSLVDPLCRGSHAPRACCSWRWSAPGSWCRWRPPPAWWPWAAWTA